MLSRTRTWCAFCGFQEDLENGEEVATCPSCSLIVKVIYDKVDALWFWTTDFRSSWAHHLTSLQMTSDLNSVVVVSGAVYDRRNHRGAIRTQTSAGLVLNLHRRLNQLYLNTTTLRVGKTTDFMSAWCWKQRCVYVQLGNVRLLKKLQFYTCIVWEWTQQLESDRKRRRRPGAGKMSRTPQSNIRTKVWCTGSVKKL